MFRSTKCFVMVFAFLVSSMFFYRYVHAAPVNKTILTVKASTDSKMETKLVILNNKTLELITQRGIRKNAPAIPVSDTYLTVTRNGVESTYLVDQKGNLFDEQNKEMIEIQEDIKMELVKYVENLRSAHYGKLVQWNKANHTISKKMKFKVIDMETGLAFNVQRRAGKNHADVQPLTKEDTAIMKQIYNGKWSWQRKAILVQTENQLLAASMHGMPHGGDGIPNNGFSGHFCIHFLGSSTHGSGNVDPEHQLMVFKAAGKLDDYFDHASPYQIVDTFFLALNLKEPQILAMSFTHIKHNQLDFFLKDKDQIEGIRKRSNYVEKDISDFLTLEIPIEVSIYRKGQREEKTMFTFQMKRTSLTEPWKIESIGMIS